MKSVWRISEKRGAREGCANYESNRWRGNGEEVERGRGFIMQSRWLRLQLCFLSSRHRPRENSLRRLRRFGYGFDHVADRGHLRRALEKVNYAGGTRPLSISKERVERIVCELRITDFSRYNSSFRPPIRRLVWKFERWKFRWKERGCSRLEKYWRTLRAIRWRKCNRRNSFRYTNFSTVRTQKSSKDREEWTRQSFSTCNGWLARACTT